GELDHLVFERWAVAWTDAANLSVEERRAIEVRAHELVNAIVRVEQVTVDLRSFDTSGHERERDRLRIAALHCKLPAAHLAIEVDARAIEPRWSTGLQSSPFEANRLERLRELS